MFTSSARFAPSGDELVRKVIERAQTPLELGFTAEIEESTKFPERIADPRVDQLLHAIERLIRASLSELLSASNSYRREW